MLSPGPISNTKLLHPNNHRTFGVGLQIGTHYRVVNEEIWDLIEQVYGGGPPISVPGSMTVSDIELEAHATIHSWRNSSITNNQLHQIRQDDLLARARSKDNNAVSICLDAEPNIVSNSSDSESTATFSANSSEFTSPSRQRSQTGITPTSLSEGGSDRCRAHSSPKRLSRLNSEPTGKVRSPLKTKSVSADFNAWATTSMDGSEDTGSMFSDVELTSSINDDGAYSEEDSSSSSNSSVSARASDVGTVRAMVESYERRRERRPSLAAKGMKSGMQTVFVVKVCVGEKDWKLCKRYKYVCYRVLPSPDSPLHLLALLLFAGILLCFMVTSRKRFVA